MQKMLLIQHIQPGADIWCIGLDGRLPYPCPWAFTVLDLGYGVGDALMLPSTICPYYRRVTTHVEHCAIRLSA